MHRQNSQATSRQKLSLRNLLNMQYESQHQSTTLNARPKTMYNQRQLKIFQEERGHLMSQNRMRRGVSQQLSRPKYQSTENAPEDRVQKQRLKHALGKINLLASGSIQVEEEERIRAIYVFLQSLSKTENFYKAAFNYIYESYNEIVYINKIQWKRQNIEFIISKSQNEILIKLYNGVKDISYKELSNELFNELERQLIETNMYQQSTSQRSSLLESKLKEKNQMIKKLCGEIDYYENHPSKEQYGYITELEQKTSSLQRELRQANTHVKELENSEEYLNQYTNMLNEKVEELRAKLYQFEIEQFSSLKQVEKNSQLKQFEQNVIVLKDLIHKGALRMSSMREEYNKLEAYNHELVGQRSVLAKRAAVGFAELTPRPNYKQIFKDNEIDPQKLLPQNVKPSTEELVSSLIKCFRNVFHKYVATEPKLEIEPGKESIESGQKKDPAKFILGQIDKARKQLKKTESLSQEVHQGYKKQKEEKNQKGRRK